MKRNKFGNIFLLIFLVVVVVFLTKNPFWEKQIQENEVFTGDEGALEVHFIDVGQGDATLIFQDAHAMLVDGGDNLRGWQIVDYLNYLGIEHLDYVIATHPDADHIGGLDTVLEHISCKMVLMPEYERDTQSYEGLVEVLEETNVNTVSPQPGETYSLGTADFTILAPGSSYENVNDNSIAFRLVHGKNSFLFTGDAESASEAEMLKSGKMIAADVYKVAHHGSSSANTEAFLQEIKPTYAVISCGEGNDYGHPHSEVLNRLRMLGTEVFRTDEQGTIVAVSDGETLKFHMPPSETWQSGN